MLRALERAASRRSPRRPPTGAYLSREPSADHRLPRVSRELRLLDPADELGFLALECERFGAPKLATTIFGIYSAVTGDAPPHALVHFYQSYRACVRARIAIRHLADAAPRDPAKWPAQARAYLTLGGDHLQRCAVAQLAPAQPPCSSTIEPPL
jgi:hypothetical protein